MLQDRAICKVEDGEPVKVGTVIGKLFDEVGPLFAERNGGYTRIINLPLRRVGDNGRLVLLQLVKDQLKAKDRSAKVSETTESDRVSPVAESLTDSETETETPADGQAEAPASSDVEPEGTTPSPDAEVAGESEETSTADKDSTK